MSSVWSAIDDSKKYSADNDDILRAEELYNTAKEDFGKKDYTKAEIQLNQAEELAKKSKEEHYEKYLSTEIDKLRKKVIELKIMGIDVGEIEKSISKVEAAFDKKDYRNIGNLMKTTRGLISSVERVKYMQKASDEISFSKALIKYIKHNIKGLGSKIKSAEDLIRLSEKAFNQSNYFEAEKLAVDSKESVEHIEHPKLQQFLFVFKQLRAEEMIDETKKLFGNIRKIGINISSAEELYKKGEAALRDDATYEEGREFLTQAKISAKDVERDFHKKNASSAISAAQSLIIEVKKTGVDITEPKKFLDQGKSAYEDGEYKKSILFAGKAKMAAKKFQK
jgi:tetratricopeptide (TPR) repeat protein